MTAYSRDNYVSSVSDDFHRANNRGDEAVLSKPGFAGKERIEVMFNEEALAHIHEARRIFDALKRSDSYLDDVLINQLRGAINLHLEEANTDLAILDPEGKRSVEEIEQDLERVVANAHIVSARKQFVTLKRADRYLDISDINNVVSSIRSHLSKAKVNVCVLDPSGKSNEEEMEEQLNQAIVSSHIISAHVKLELLEHTRAFHESSTVKMVVLSIYASLQAAGIDASALDSSGHTGKAEMEDRINRAAQKAMRNKTYALQFS